MIYVQQDLINTVTETGERWFAMNSWMHVNWMGIRRWGSMNLDYDHNNLRVAGEISSKYNYETDQEWLILTDVKEERLMPTGYNQVKTKSIRFNNIRRYCNDDYKSQEARNELQSRTCTICERFEIED